MSYKNNSLPPIVRRTAIDHYQLEDQSGTILAEYTTKGMDHPGGWWGDFLGGVRAEYASIDDYIHDVTLLMMQQDWVYEDETL